MLLVKTLQVQGRDAGQILRHWLWDGEKRPELGGISESEQSSFGDFLGRWGR